MNKTSLISSFARKMDLYQFMIPGTILLEQYLINPFYHVAGGTFVEHFLFSESIVLSNLVH